MIGTTANMYRAQRAQRQTEAAERIAVNERNAAREAHRLAEMSAANARREAQRALAIGESMRGILGAARPDVDVGNPYTQADQILQIIVAQIAARLKDQPQEQVQARAALAETL